MAAAHLYLCPFHSQLLATSGDLHWVARLNPGVVVAAERPAFSVPQANSQWTLSFKNSFSLKVKYQGRIWVDPATRNILRISQRADLPAKSPISYAEATTEFGMTAVQGLNSPQYLLPLSSEVIVQEAEGHYSTRNRIEFRDFRRFTAEVTFQEQ